MTGTYPTITSDGTPEDTQDAIDASIAAGNAGTVLIPAGTFEWSTGVSWDTGAVKLQGEGAGRIVARSFATGLSGGSTPTDAITFGTGTKVWTLADEDEDKSPLYALRSEITAGRELQVWRIGSAEGGPVDQWMKGTVTSLVGSTLTMNITESSGTGTEVMWVFATMATTTLVNAMGAQTNLIYVGENASVSNEITGIKFTHAVGAYGTADTYRNFIRMQHASGGKPILVHDCYFQMSRYSWNILAETNKGIIYNCTFHAVNFAGTALAISQRNGGLVGSWNTDLSTMGDADTTGTSNLYCEDCDFHAYCNAQDIDDNARFVVRHSLYNNARFGSHGADSSNYGMRHFEVYDCDFVFNGYNDGRSVNLVCFFLIRGGTGVITDNNIPAFTGWDYSGATEIHLAQWNLQFNQGPNPEWGRNVDGIQWPVPRQVGQGRVTGAGMDYLGRTNDGHAYVGDLEPLYIWNNTGSYEISLDAYPHFDSGEDAIADYIIEGRDYYHNVAKPGYSKFEYPHPLRVDYTPPAVATPSFSPAAGTYTSTQNVTITCSTPDTTIYYTVDGSTPDNTDTVYSSPVAIAATTTLKAIASDGVEMSSVRSGTYTITAPPVVYRPKKLKFFRR